MSLEGNATTTNNLNVLRGKIASLSPYAVDKTLSVEGASADAKAVGDALEKKVNYTDIVDNLTSSDSDKPLSAKQGKAIKSAIDNLKAETNEAVELAKTNASNAQSAAQSAQTSAVTAQETADNAQTAADGKIAPDGSVAMTADFNMDSNKVVNLADPEKETDAANKKYVDSKKFEAELTLVPKEWASFAEGGVAPYRQTVAVAGILATDKPHWSVVYSSDEATRLEEKKAFAYVDDLDTEDGSVVFTCFEKKPTIDLVIQMEVNR